MKINKQLIFSLILSLLLSVSCGGSKTDMVDYWMVGDDSKFVKYTQPGAQDIPDLEQGQFTISIVTAFLAKFSDFDSIKSICVNLQLLLPGSHTLMENKADSHWFAPQTSAGPYLDFSEDQQILLETTSSVILRFRICKIQPVTRREQNIYLDYVMSLYPPGHGYIKLKYAALLPGKFILASEGGRIPWNKLKLNNRSRLVFISGGKEYRKSTYLVFKIRHKKTGGLILRQLQLALVYRKLLIMF